MTTGLHYTVFETDAGWMGLLASPGGLRRVTLPQESAQAVRQQLGASLNFATEAPHLFDKLVHRFKRYFKGEKVAFPDELDLVDVTYFQRKVWEATRSIPYGETRSYTWIAEQIKKPMAVRAVGQALGRNPLPVIVPCHRVLAKSGKLGGFTGGIELKRNLLNMEKIRVNP
ncbi:methylated-DNA--[protein]-cysteine S-methyltransferase [Chloroflexota bacterium]